MQGRPGPVVIALPEDVLTDLGEVADAPRAEPAPIWPGLTQMAELQKMLWAAERPIAIVGGPGWTRARDRRASLRFAERFDLPVAAHVPARERASTASTRTMPARSASRANPKLKARIESADLVLLIGGRMSEAASQGYTLFDIPTPRQKLVHVHADPNEIGRNYHPTLGIVATSAAFCRGARRRAAARRDPLDGRDARGARRLSRLERAGAARRPGAVQLARDHVRAAPARPRRDLHHRRRQFRDLGRTASCASARFEQQLGPTCGSMGFGLPAAIAAKQSSIPSASSSASPATAIS